MMCTDRVSKIVGMEIALHRQAVVRPLGEIVQRNEFSSGIMLEFVPFLVDESVDTRKVTAVLQRSDELEEGPFSLSEHAVIDGVVTQDDVGMVGREVAAPDDRHARQRSFEPPAVGHGTIQLGARHYGHGDGRDLARTREFEDVLDRIVVQVAVHDLIIEDTLQHGGRCQQRHRQRLLVRRRAPGVIENNHGVATSRGTTFSTAVSPVSASSCQTEFRRSVSARIPEAMRRLSPHRSPSSQVSRPLTR